jgi:hypothetical protein
MFVCKRNKHLYRIQVQALLSLLQFVSSSPSGSSLLDLHIKHNMNMLIYYIYLLLALGCLSGVLCQQQQQKTGQQQQRPAATQHPGKHRKQLPTTTTHNRDKHWLSRGQHVRMPCPKGNLQCKAMSDMMAQLEFQPGFGPRVNCTCAQFEAGVCFAPGCFPCAKSCLSKELAALPGPFGTGLLCSSGGFML